MQHRINATTPKLPLHDLRTARSLTQAEVAQRVNRTVGGSSVTADMVSRWERGECMPLPHYRRALAEVFDVTIADLGFALTRAAASRPRQVEPLFMDEPAQTTDPRVTHSQQEWVATRRALNARRPTLSRFVADAYPPRARLGTTGLLAPPEWIPDVPVELGAVKLNLAAVGEPELNGTESESASARPLHTLTRPFQRYTQAVRDLARPRLFENRMSWRLTDLDWSDGNGLMTFAPTTFFAAMDVCDTAAHETALVHLGADGEITGYPTLRDLPFRRLIDDPFAFTRRPILPAISTLTIRAGDAPSFILHRRDSQKVAMAGGSLQVIPSGIFQPSSVHPIAVQADFDLWRNIMREAAEELLGMDEHDGDGQPVNYSGEPFAGMEAARWAGLFRVHCFGVALDALTLMGEILTVAVVDPEVFDDLARDFVTVNDEGTVVAEQQPFTEGAVSRLLASGRMAPAGAGCLELAWRHRERLLG